MLRTTERESSIQKKILKALRAKGGFWINTHGGPMQARGLPDIIGCYCGRFVGIEVKRPSTRNHVSELQKLAIAQIKAQGGIAFVATSVEEALEQLATEIIVS